MAEDLMKGIGIGVMLFVVGMLTLFLFRNTINSADMTRIVTEGESVQAFAETIALDALELNMDESFKIQKIALIQNEGAVADYIVQTITDRYSSRSDITIRPMDITNLRVERGSYTTTGSGRDRILTQTDAQRPEVSFDVHVNFTSVINNSGPRDQVYRIHAKITHIPQN